MLVGWRTASLLLYAIASFRCTDASSNVLRKGSTAAKDEQASARGAMLRSSQPLIITNVINEHPEMATVGLYRIPQKQILDIQPRQVTPQEELWEWREFDQNQDGQVSMGELEAFFYEMKPTKQQLEKMYKKLDLDNNGVITWSDFNTAADTELFSFFTRSRGEVTEREVEYVEDLYDAEFGNPYAQLAKEKPSEYNMRGEEITPPAADAKYLPGYGWFSGESPVVDMMYPNMQENPDKDKEAKEDPDKHYHYSYR
eukprot:gnl/TRDRNA2_/TRDRNA2_181298_c0_seq1.p1 gnl/TRDRNA2_/TRDRNA2_181298_c0~~gnl/TRDRNA2_/TRDRNA2_181298_c0_seq1.p1  ORF type:complete len:256 (-),score=70.58 gnl/TRDRNA2_/TRDRNA2_181298_c0_seq1:53-820(-)